MHPTRRKALAEYSSALRAMREAETAEGKRAAIQRYEMATVMLGRAEFSYPTRQERQARARSANYQPSEVWRLWRA